MKLKDLAKPEMRTGVVNASLTAAFVIFSFWILAIKNPSMLRWYDELSLFEPDVFFFRSFLYYPGGLLRYASTFLMQFLYYPAVGSAILILLWLFTAALTKAAFGFSRALYPLTLLVPVCMLVSVVQLDEAWLSLKSSGYLFFPTLGYLFTLFAFWLFRKCATRRIVAWSIALLIPLFYPVAGFYALLAGVLCIFSCIARGIAVMKGRSERTRDGRKGNGLIYFVVALLILIFIITVPRIYYIYCPGTTVDNDYLLLKGLPELLMESHDLYLWRPFIVASALILIFALARISGIHRFRENAMMQWGALLIMVGGIVWAIASDHKSEQLRATVLMLRAIERNDWGGVIHILSLTREAPNYSMLVLANLAKVNLGGQSDNLAQYQPALADRRHAEKFTVTAFVEVPVNYFIGRFNQSYRWAMEHTVQYGKRVYFLKYMVKDALMRGETQLAKKYNDILLSTMFHRKWAEEMNRYIENPALIKDNPEFVNVLLMKDAEIKRGE